MQEYRVALEDVRFFAYHGLFPEERILGNWFVLSVCVSKEAKSLTFDKLDQTFDYGQIYTICQEVMADPVDLLETVAQRIADRIKKTFNDMSRYEIQISKEQPPLGMLGGKSSVSLIESMGN